LSAPESLWRALLSRYGQSSRVPISPAFSISTSGDASCTTTSSSRIGLGIPPSNIAANSGCAATATSWPELSSGSHTGQTITAARIQIRTLPKVAVVTGASKGIGAAIARSLGAAGASVVVNYASDKAGADKVVAAITAAGSKAVAVKGDVSKTADAQAIIDAAIKTYGKLDVLVNNSGVYEMLPLEAITPEHFHKQFDVNVLGLLLVTQAAVPHLPKGGSIINIGSLVSRITPPMSAVYSATKGAVDVITGVLSLELGSKGIRINALNPGLVETEGTHTAGFISSDFAKGAEAQTPLGRIGQPQGIADAAVLLASDQAGWINGQIINAAGGAR
jgi:3-oxoacyl-[acyl-carrier protein] reductase